MVVLTRVVFENGEYYLFGEKKRVKDPYLLFGYVECDLIDEDDDYYVNGFRVKLKARRVKSKLSRRCVSYYVNGVPVYV